jgi:hypothetical protein
MSICNVQFGSDAVRQVLSGFLRHEQWALLVQAHAHLAVMGGGPDVNCVVNVGRCLRPYFAENRSCLPAACCKTDAVYPRSD